MSSSAQDRLAATIGAPEQPEPQGLDRPGKLAMRLTVSGEGASGMVIATQVSADQLLETGVGDRALREAIEDWKRNGRPPTKS